MNARLNEQERARYQRDGYVARKGVFDANEVRQIAQACEDLISWVLTQDRKAKEEAGAYVFEWLTKLKIAVKWEKDNRDVVLGLEPFAHLSPALERWANDARLIDPMKDVLGFDSIELFTEKLNVKRAEHGGPIVLHQDFPYWVRVAEDPRDVGTAILFLDDATVDNGCLEVVPGSHREGVRQRQAVEGFGGHEMVADKHDLDRMIPLEVPAGSVVWFGSLLVHRSAPNRTKQDRRALLYSYQPTGRRHLREAVFGK
jgi:ectoine hydroxylase